MDHIERVIVDESVGPDSELMAQFRDRLGGRQVVFVFLSREHPGIPDIEILDKLLDRRSILLTQDRVLHNLAIGRGFRSMIKTPETGLTDRRLAHVVAAHKHFPVSGTLRDSYKQEADPEARAITGSISGFLSAKQLKQFAPSAAESALISVLPTTSWPRHSRLGNGAPRGALSAATS
jgi:hypothetical protein